MNNGINISQSQIVLAFVATCVEATARTLGVNYLDVFMRMKRLGMIENYIIPNYGVLHTESRENIVLDMIHCMDAWEAKKLERLSEHRPNNQMCLLSQELINKYLRFNGADEI